MTAKRTSKNSGNKNYRSSSSKGGGHGKGGSSYDNDRYSKGNDSYNDNYNSSPSKGGHYDDGGYGKGGSSYEDNRYSKGNDPYNDDYDSSPSKGGHYDDGGAYGKGGSSYNDDRYSKGNDSYNDDYGGSPSKGGDDYEKGGSPYDNEPINDPPYDDSDESEEISKQPQTDNRRNTSKGNGDSQPEADMTFTEEEVYGDNTADMTFTEEEVYGDMYDAPVRDEVYDDEAPDQDTDSWDTPVSPASLTQSQVQRVKRRMRIPDDGFLVTTSRGRLRRNLEVERTNQLLEQLENEDTDRHIRNTIRLFTEDRDERSHQDRNQIDIAFALAVAIRESGVRTAISRSERRIVTAGRDAHTEGRSGLDWVYDYKRYFPSSIRNEVQPVVGNSRVSGSFRRNVHPAYLRERDLLAAFIVEIRMRHRRFLRRFHNHEFRNGFTAEQRRMLLDRMNSDAKRAWTQAAFGSRIHDLLVEARQLIRNRLNDGASFSQVVEDDMVNLNSIITNDSIMPTNLSRQRTRISAAEGLLIEEIVNGRY